MFTLAEQSAQSHALFVPQRQHSKPSSVLFFSLCMISVMVNNIGEVFTQFVNYFLSHKTQQHEAPLV